MTILRCKVCRPSPDNMFTSPESLAGHMEEFHDPDTELARELGIEFVDGELPSGIRAKGFSLDPRVLKLLENQPNTWCKVWTAKDDNDAKSSYTKRNRCMKLYPKCEWKVTTWMGDKCLFGRWVTT